jgi:hypothetical protein
MTCKFVVVSINIKFENRKLHILVDIFSTFNSSWFGIKNLWSSYFLIFEDSLKPFWQTKNSKFKPMANIYISLQKPIRQIKSCRSKEMS